MGVVLREQRRERRRKVAEAMMTGEQPDSVMQKFEVSITTVRNACKEFEVELPTKRLYLNRTKQTGRCRKCGYIWTFLPHSGRVICEICMYRKVKQ